MHLHYLLGIALAGSSQVVASFALLPRQSIDFDLIDEAPEPLSAPDNSTGYNAATALAAVVADVSEDPLIQTQTQRRSPIQRRDIIVDTMDGYTDNVALGSFAINAPLDCNGKDTYMGAKIFTDGTFDTKKCAAACSAQTEYNAKHPPASGISRTCQFYNTFASYKNDVYQAAWTEAKATNKGQYRGRDSYTIRDSYMASIDFAANEASCVLGIGNPIACPNFRQGFYLKSDTDFITAERPDWDGFLALAQSKGSQNVFHLNNGVLSAQTDKRGDQEIVMTDFGVGSPIYTKDRYNPYAQLLHTTLQCFPYNEAMQGYPVLITTPQYFVMQKYPTTPYLVVGNAYLGPGQPLKIYAVPIDIP